MAVKTSKFRYTKPTPCMKAKEVVNLAPTSAIWDCGNFLAVNEKHIAIPWSQLGSTVVIGHHEYGKLSPTPPMLMGHTGPVIDLSFNPFAPDMLATGSEDATVKIWKIPEGGVKSNTTHAQTTLTGHTKKVGILTWHPSARNVLATSGPDSIVNLWDVEVETPKISIDTHKDHVLSVQWNLDGSMLATTSKDKKFNVIDSRTGDLVISTDAHQGSKTQRLVWAKRRGLIVTVGFNRQQFREAMVWDVRNLAIPVCKEDVDQQSSVMAPYIDEDTNILYIAGKGDGTIKLYDLYDDARPIVYINQFAATDAQRGIALMPKKCLDVKQCEIARIYRLTPKSLHHISFTVPRKTGSSEFQADLYPPTFSDEPSLSSRAFFEEGKNAEPGLISMLGHFTGEKCETIPSTKVISDSHPTPKAAPTAPPPATASSTVVEASSVKEWDGHSVPSEQQISAHESRVDELKRSLENATKTLELMRVAASSSAAAPDPSHDGEQPSNAAVAA